MANRRQVILSVLILVAAPSGFPYVPISQPRRNNGMGVNPYSYTPNTPVLVSRDTFGRVICWKKQAFTVFLSQAEMIYIQVQT
jgi:hypothetical protein